MLKIREYTLITFVAVFGAIECLDVSSKIAFEPVKPSFSLTSYASEPDLIEFGDSTLDPKLPPSAFKQLNFGTQMVDILKPQDSDKLKSSSYTILPSSENQSNCPPTDEQPANKKNHKNCQNGLCDFSSTTTRDLEGNLITTVKFSIITKTTDIKTNGIPVIDGVRGILPASPPPLNFPNRPNFIRHIPQINKQPSNFVPLRNIMRPQLDPYYSYVFGRGIESSPQNPWMTGVDLVDDKIEPPFSKTTANK